MQVSPIYLIDNAYILTQNPDYPVATAVAYANGRILALDDAARALPAAQTFDVQGKTLVPGFNDVHAHSTWFGQTLVEVDLAGCTSAQQVYETLSAGFAGSAQPWLVASGFVPGDLQGEPLNITSLDDVAQGKPLLIKHNSGHAYTVNTAALELADVDPSNPPDIEGGEIVTDSEGHATGLLDENAMRLIQDLILPESLEDISAALERATKAYLAEGLTSVTDAGVAGGWIGHSPREVEAYQMATLHTRMQVMVTMDALHEIEGHETDGAGWGLDGGIRTGLGNEWLQIGPTKIFTDGSLLGTTAAMSENYECCHHAGYFQGDKEQMRERALRAAGAGWSLAMHAIGDAAVDFAIEVIGQAIERHGRPQVPHRIEHGGVVRDDQIARLKELGIVLVPQPLFIHLFGDKMAEKLGPERTALSYPGQRLVDAGLVVPGSSDRPVAPGAPLRIMQAFVERTTSAGLEYGPADRMSIKDALYAYTAGSAAATGWAGVKGQIACGQLADFVLLADNPLEVETSAIGGIEVLATVVGGECRYGSLER